MSCPTRPPKRKRPAPLRRPPQTRLCVPTQIKACSWRNQWRQRDKVQAAMYTPSTVWRMANLRLMEMKRASLTATSRASLISESYGCSVPLMDATTCCKLFHSSLSTSTWCIVKSSHWRAPGLTARNDFTAGKAGCNGCFQRKLGFLQFSLFSSQLLRHLEQEHTSVQVKCNKCYEPLRSTKNEYYHQVFSHEKGMFRCAKDGCRYVNHYRIAVIHHYETHHQEDMSRQWTEIRRVNKLKRKKVEDEDSIGDNQKVAKSAAADAASLHVSSPSLESERESRRPNRGPSRFRFSRDSLERSYGF